MGLVMDEKTGKYAVLSRHRRRRRSLRRHGLQGRRHRRRHHGAADGHQGRRHHHRGHAEGARAGAPRPAAHPRQDAARRSPASRQNISAFAPRIVTIRIPVDKIRDVIGPGGKMIRSIIERTGVKIDVEDDGRVNVASADETSAAEGDLDHPGADGDARAEQDLSRQGPAHHRFRRVRRDHAGHRRPAARLGNRESPREGRARRAEGRRTAAGQGDQHRSDRQDSFEPEGAAAGRAAHAAAGGQEPHSGHQSLPDPTGAPVSSNSSEAIHEDRAAVVVNRPVPWCATWPASDAVSVSCRRSGGGCAGSSVRPCGRGSVDGQPVHVRPARSKCLRTISSRSSCAPTTSPTA